MCPHIRPGTLKIKMLLDHSEYIQMQPGLHYDSTFYYKRMKSNYKLKGRPYVFRTLDNSRYGSTVNNTDVILQMMNPDADHANPNDGSSNVPFSGSHITSSHTDSSAVSSD